MTAGSVTTGRARRGTIRAGGVVRVVLLVIFALPWIGVPLWLLVVNSFKSEGEASVLSLAPPENWAALENYTAVFEGGNYLVGLKNSLLVTVPVVAAVLVLGSMAAWGYARSSRRWSQFFFYVSALSILLPPAIIPTIFVLTTMGLDGSLWGYALMNVGTRLGLVIFLTTGFARSMPIELEEAAAIDGASRWRTYRSVVLPMLRPILFVGAILTIIGVWNDYFFALLLLKSSANATLPLTLFSFASSTFVGLKWNLIFAHVVMSSLPLLIAYAVAQRQVLAGLTEGGLKG